MTQAKNVALGVSNFNSSGVLSVAGGGTGTSTGYFPSGTALVFKQTAAPTGWTKVVTDNDAALRIVSGAASTGGSVGFTTAFASQAVSGTVGTTGSTTATNQNTTATGSVGTSGSTTATGTVGATTLSTSQIPVHSHANSLYSNTVASDGHYHFIYTTGNASYRAANGLAYTNGGSVAYDASFYTYGNSGSITVGISNANAGSGGSHDHSFSGTAHTHTGGTFTGTAHTHTQDAHTHTGGTFTGTAINLAVKYVDVIVATKD